MKSCYRHTDSRHCAGLTKNIYRFLPITLRSDDAKRYHGIDERISVSDYERCVRFYAQLMRNSNRQATATFLPAYAESHGRPTPP